MKRKLGPTDIIFPVPAALVGSGTPTSPNLLTVAWIGMMGSDPPILAISLKKSRYSLGMIRKEKEFTVNIPSAKQFREADYCGLVSGRKRQKFQDCGFTPAAASVVKTPLVEECPFNLECKVLRDIEFGDWVVVFGEIVETHVDADKLDPQTGKIDIHKIDPLVYCATVREYWNLGGRLGFGFRAGKELVEKYDAAPMLEGNVATCSEVVLRQATADQFDATFAIKKASGGSYIRDVFGWDEDIQVGFHQRQFSPENTHLVLLGGAIVGWVSVFDDDDCTKIEELYVLPEFQKHGIGTAVLLEVIAHAKRRQVPLRLRVFKINYGARRLYERLGFRAGEDDGPFLYMTLVFQAFKESGSP